MDWDKRDFVVPAALSRLEFGCNTIGCLLQGYKRPNVEAEIHLGPLIGEAQAAYCCLSWSSG
jgi:hypothetical protein